LREPAQGDAGRRRDLAAGPARAGRFRDGLAAQRYVRHLVANGGSDSDIAYFGSIAVATGRVWTLPETVKAMLRLDPATEPPERVKVYMAMIYPHAWAGNSLALDAVVMLNGKGRLFGEMSDRTRKQLDEQMRRRSAMAGWNC
jgi:hypothetical protein